jgi:uncharacterized membrane protein YgdD (TMEM256/DUF423 family)
MRFWLVAAAVNGFIAVAMGAFAAHGLPAAAASQLPGWVDTGARYEMWHAVALLAVALLVRVDGAGAGRRWLDLAGWGFLIGMVLFSGSLYLMALTRLPFFALITPFGGLAFLVGWAALGIYGVTRRAG